MKWFSNGLATIALLVTLGQCHPADAPADTLPIVEKRDGGEVNVVGRRVAVVTGIVLNQALYDCFSRDGLSIAKGWAGALYDQWRFSYIPGTLVDIQAYVSTVDLSREYCITVDAMFNFAGISDAQKFATRAAHFLNAQKNSPQRDENSSQLDKPMGVFVEGVDLPIGHPYFGNATDISESENTDATSDGLVKRGGYRSCQNKCAISFTSMQTNICRDEGFPPPNRAFC